MNFLSNYFNDGKYLNLAETETKKRGRRPQSAISESVTHKNMKDVIKTLSESDWFTFAMINLSTTMFSKARFTMVSKDEETWKKFFDNMRLYGDNTSLRRLREETKRDMITYGSCYLEFVPDEAGTEILDLKRIDASRMRNAKDKKNQLILDEKGNSIGYVLRLGANADLRSKGDQIPEQYDGSIDMQHGDIFLSPKRVAEIRLYTRPNGIEAIGLIESSIQQTRRRMDLETAQVNAIWIRGTAPLFATVGDPNHEPNPQMMEDALDSLTDLKHSKVSAFPHYIEPKTLDAKIDNMATVISNGLLSASASSAGIPLPFVTGQGEATNRATLKTQREVFEDNMQDKINNYDEDWNLLVMNRIAEVNSYVPGKIISSKIRLETKEEFANRLKTYFEMGAFSPKEIRMNIKSNDDLMFDDADYALHLRKQEAKAKEENSSEDNPKKENDKKFLNQSEKILKETKKLLNLSEEKVMDEEKINEINEKITNKELELKMKEKEIKLMDRKDKIVKKLEEDLSGRS